MIDFLGAGATEEDVGQMLGRVVFQGERKSFEVKGGIYLAVLGIPVMNFTIKATAYEVLSWMTELDISNCFSMANVGVSTSFWLYYIEKMHFS